MCSTYISSVTPVKLYTRKEFILLETLISEFHSKYYIPAIQKLAFHFPHVHIIGTHHRGKEHHESFRRSRKHHDALCRSDCAEWIVSSFTHQIQSEYCGGNWYASIEAIALENFSASNQASS